MLIHSCIYSKKSTLINNKYLLGTQTHRKQVVKHVFCLVRTEKNSLFCNVN